MSLDRIAVAIDTADRAELSRLCRLFGPSCGVLKIGLEAFAGLGPWAVEEAAGHCRRVFLDLKLHDIPSTVAGAVRSARRLGASLLTVHASGGRSMLRAAADAAAGEVTILAVTVLTHLDCGELEELGIDEDAPTIAGRRARIAALAGCGGLVCSPRELATLRPAYPPPFLMVTPGIRPSGAARDDQRRVATPAEALAAGSDLLVIGRPLTRAADPEAALARLAAELSSPGEAPPRT